MRRVTKNQIQPLPPLLPLDAALEDFFLLLVEVVEPAPAVPAVPAVLDATLAEMAGGLPAAGRGAGAGGGVGGGGGAGVGGGAIPIAARSGAAPEKTLLSAGTGAGAGVVATMAAVVGAAVGA